MFYFVCLICLIQGDTSVNTNDDRVEDSDTDGDNIDWNIDDEFPNQLTDTPLMGDDAAVNILFISRLFLELTQKTWQKLCNRYGKKVKIKTFLLISLTKSDNNSWRRNNTLSISWCNAFLYTIRISRQSSCNVKACYLQYLDGNVIFMSVYLFCYHSICWDYSNSALKKGNVYMIDINVNILFPGLKGLLMNLFQYTPPAVGPHYRTILTRIQRSFPQEVKEHFKSYFTSSS